MIKAVIFDCFGVLASDGWLPFKARYFDTDSTLNEQATLLNKAVDVGQASYDEFVRRVAAMAHITEDTARQQIENNIPDERLFAYIKDLKPAYQIGLLSNAGDDWLSDIFTPEQVALFDATALSYEIGVLKPGDRAYEIIAERLQVKPEECVFIDDQPNYIDGAKRVGMKAILYTNAEQLKLELAPLLANS